MKENEWLNRYKEELIHVAGLTIEQACDCAAAVPWPEIADGFEDDPEMAAAEEMSYWDT